MQYEAWCANVVERMIELLPPDNVLGSGSNPNPDPDHDPNHNPNPNPNQVCILYQTPGRYSAEGGAWLDKGFFCQLGAPT